MFNQGEADLAGDVMIILDSLSVSRNGMMLIPELYAVPENQVLPTFFYSSGCIYSKYPETEFSKQVENC